MAYNDATHLIKVLIVIVRYYHTHVTNHVFVSADVMTTNTNTNTNTATNGRTVTDWLTALAAAGSNLTRLVAALASSLRSIVLNALNF